MKVSVIIPTRDRYDLLLNAIKSVKAQTYKDFEIIVVNDRSTDEQYATTDWEKLGVKYFSTNKKSGNPANARNIGVAKSEGKLIALLDDDDMWLPEKLEKQVDFMVKNKHKFTYTEAFYSPTDHKYSAKKSYKKYLSEQYHAFILDKFGFTEMPETITLDMVEKHNLLITSSVMIDKKLVEKVGLFNNGKSVKWDDWDFWQRALKHGDCHFLNIPLTFYNDSPRAKYITHAAKFK